MTKKRKRSEAEKAARIVRRGMQLDHAILSFEEKASERFSQRAADLSADPYSSPFTDVLRTGQHYLSPLTEEEDERYWHGFIVVATKKIKDHVRDGSAAPDAEKINTELYDTLGMIITRLTHPDA